ncbi:MAG: FkbM family methyltransferase [Candidatus Parcubacteria bacterium]|nr:FkbM family methyltransferase [Candidatus Parcubacteria bacterium]
MRRKVEDFISLAALKHLYCVPIIIFKIKNWYAFLLNYMGFKNEANTYKFRNGINIKTDEGVDSDTITVIFIKKDYGKIKDNSIIIDIGANIGVLSVFAASTSKNTIVYAYEPMPRSYDLLLENISINKLEKNILPFKLGIGAKKEKRKLFLANGSPFHSLYTNEIDKNYLEIECISLGDIFESNHLKECDILKIDCEGAEFEILYNTLDKYLKCIKEIRLEYHDQKIENYNIKSLIKFLKDRGFHLTNFRNDKKYIYSGNAWFRRM